MPVLPITLIRGADREGYNGGMFDKGSGEPKEKSEDFLLLFLNEQKIALSR
jgi:hypothetical protein